MQKILDLIPLVKEIDQLKSLIIDEPGILLQKETNKLISEDINRKCSEFKYELRKATKGYPNLTILINECIKEDWADLSKTLKCFTSFSDRELAWDSPYYMLTKLILEWKRQSEQYSTSELTMHIP